MKWYFQPQPDRDGNGAGRDDDADSPGLLDVPEELLHRHGARVLRPGHASIVPDYPAPRSTVYRARTLLVPGDLVDEDPDFLQAVRDALADTGMTLVLPEDDGGTDRGPERGDPDVFRALRALPRVAVLVPREDYGKPVEIDAWTALQTLRAATAPDPRTAGGASDPAPHRLDQAKVARIELEHLLAGSAITGAPIGRPGGGIAGGPGGSDGPSATGSYLFSGGDPRTPVGVFLDPPWRRPADECAARYGRRAVVAVFDTGGAPHPWLDVSADGAGGFATVPDGFIAVDEPIQAVIRAASEQAAALGDRPRRVIKDAWDGPMLDSPLLGELNPAYGHSTAIAGIVRQVAPDARVLAVRVMGGDDTLYEGDVICALSQLAARIALAEPGDLAAQVDVLSLSFGYFSESRHDRVLTSGLWQVIQVLLSLGVVVVAAAGNYATTRFWYPAAFAREPLPSDEVPVISVGALNPNGTKAMFSNDGRWVTAWAAGAAVVTTYPTDATASRTPELRVPVNREPAGHWPPGREALDPNDYSAGFVVWSGTSFAAPYAAALVSRSLLDNAAGSAGGLRLDQPGTAERKTRAVAACDHLPGLVT
jgi:subtilisin family serine protease